MMEVLFLWFSLMVIWGFLTSRLYSKILIQFSVLISWHFLPCLTTSLTVFFLVTSREWPLLALLPLQLFSKAVSCNKCSKCNVEQFFMNFLAKEISFMNCLWRSSTVPSFYWVAYIFSITLLELLVYSGCKSFDRHICCEYFFRRLWLTI